MQIDGRTRVIPHLAYPSAHLRTPQLVNARLSALGLNAVVIPWEVPPSGLAEVLAAFRQTRSVPGMIVTIPHKEAVVDYCDQMIGVGAKLRVANVIRKTTEGQFIGALYDGKGFVGGLIKSGFTLAGARSLVLGAGGAATAVAHALLEGGIGALVIANRSAERAHKLVGLLKPLFPDRSIMSGPADGNGFDLIVNATSVGLNGDPRSPLTGTTIPATSCVADIIMKPAMTPLLKAAEKRGARIHQGEAMLLEQIDLFIDFLLGEDSVVTAQMQIMEGH